MSPIDRDRRPMVIGVGNRDRGDDAVGPIVADLTAEAGDGAIDTVVVEGDLSDLFLWWGPDRSVVIVDAMSSGRAPGTVLVIDGLAEMSDDGRADLGADRRPVSSHGVGLAEALALARVLGRLPRALTIVAIEGDAFGHLDPVSAPVASAGADVAARLAGPTRWPS